MGYLRIKNGASVARENNRYYKHEAMRSLVIDKAKTGDLKVARQSGTEVRPLFARFPSAKFRRGRAEGGNGGSVGLKEMKENSLRILE